MISHKEGQFDKLACKTPFLVQTLKSTRGKRHSPKVKLPELASAFMTLDIGIFSMEQYHEISHYYK
jgi:hypothetical protein